MSNSTEKTFIAKFEINGRIIVDERNSYNNYEFASFAIRNENEIKITFHGKRPSIKGAGQVLQVVEILSSEEEGSHEVFSSTRELRDEMIMNIQDVASTMLEEGELTEKDVEFSGKYLDKILNVLGGMDVIEKVGVYEVKTEKVVTMVETVVNDEVTMIEKEVELPVDRKTDDVSPVTELNGFQMNPQILEEVDEVKTETELRGFTISFDGNEELLKRVELMLTMSEINFNVSKKKTRKSSPRSTTSKINGTSALRKYFSETIATSPDGVTREDLFETAKEKFPTLSEVTVKTQMYQLKGGKSGSKEVWPEYPELAIEVNGRFMFPNSTPRSHSLEMIGSDGQVWSGSQVRY